MWERPCAARAALDLTGAENVSVNTGRRSIYQAGAKNLKAN